MQDGVSALVRSLEPHGPEAVRDGLLEAYPSLVQAHGEMVAASAAEFYDARRAEARVRSAMGAYFQDGDPDRLASALGASAQRYAMECADRTIRESARRDPARPRWALVAHAGACAWCLMLASRGFAYLNDRSADRARHSGCTCTPVVEFGPRSARLRGYDPEGMRARADRCRDALGSPGDVARDWARLTDAERAAFAASGRGRIDGIPDEVLRGLGDRADGFGGYYFQRVVDEMATRDRMWLFDGSLPAIDYSGKPRDTFGVMKAKSKSFNPFDYRRENFLNTQDNEWRDLFAHDALQKAGFKVEAFGQYDLDIKINGTWFEVKSSDSSKSRTEGKRYIERALRKAKKQFAKRGLSETNVVFNSLYRSYSDEEMIAELIRQKRQHGINEILFINKEGDVRRI
ncbi:hypothetical protein HLV38_02950 [Berryella wangjianweii]|uniref:tRNA nuclease CdiA C-terminal domain-containing protein n=1 Tax=Berryella wangjianweii TaxID=2734634 RepID=A0A6M8IWT8_9ACTN|nr:hypothetical protein [Berryella wangjianweii]QKF07195.1 hypothetical protein HLV38_02950 [Berryella wangjianweii]